MASNLALGGAKVESGVEPGVLVDFGSLAAEACLGPLSDIVFDVGPYESGSDETLGGFHAWV